MSFTSKGGSERPKDFHFAVTWASLLASLEPLQTADQIFVAEPSRTLAVATIEKPLEMPRETEPRTRWEMVVPKMERPPGKGPAQVRSIAPELPAARAKPPQRWLSKTLAAFSAHTRSFLPARSGNLQSLGLIPANFATLATGPERELFLSRVAQAIYEQSTRADSRPARSL